MASGGRWTEVLYQHESPVAQRILAIDEEIASLDGAVARTVLWSGVAVFLLSVFAIVLTEIGSGDAPFGFLLIATTIAAAPVAVLSLNLSINRARRRRLERELDSLIDQGSLS
jgi:hypothetical protein